MYYASVRAYETIRTTFDNNLPHPATIRSWYANSDVNCEPGISESCINIIGKYATEKQKMGSDLLVSVCFDEMYIKSYFQWCNTSKEMNGFPTYGSYAVKPDEVSENLNELDIDEAANQVLVFMVIGINQNLKLPIGYHFIRSLEGEDKRDLITSVIDALIRVNVTVVSITFDGHATNKKMCRLLGANLTLNSKAFKPYFLASNGKRVYIIFDVSHMEKLVRNILGKYGKLIDMDGKMIAWKYFEELVKLRRTEGFALTHKMTEAHIQWRSKKMKVQLAVQTLSKSTADSMQFLLEEEHPKFSDANATIRFTRIFNDLFDIFNSKSSENVRPFKRPLCAENRESIFEYFTEAIEYIKGLTIKDDTGAVSKLITSKQNTGFKGYVINMYSLMGIYDIYIADKRVIESIPTYSLSQVEFFFQ